MIIPKKSGGVRITVNDKNLNKISSLIQLPIPRVDEVLDSLSVGRVFSLLNLVSSLHQITTHMDTVPLTAFCTSTGLYEWLVMPQGSSGSPAWFIKVINTAITGLEQVAAHFNDVIVFDSDPTTHVKTTHTLYELLRKHNLKFSPTKAGLEATDAEFLGHSISPAGVCPNADKFVALIKIPMPRDLTLVRALLPPWVVWGTIANFCVTCPSGSTRPPPSSGRIQVRVYASHESNRALISPSLPLPLCWSSPTETPWLTAAAHSTRTATRSSSWRCA